MRSKKRILSLLLCAMLALSLLPARALAAEEPVKVTVFTTNDIHGMVEGNDISISLAQVAAIKASTPNALLVDAGDATQGASLATISRGEDVIAMMNAAGYDLMAAGNHDFDYGVEQLLANADAAAFPILSANMTRGGEAPLPGSVTLSVAGKTIGFIGLTTTYTAASIYLTESGVVFGSEIDAAKREIVALADETDALVLVCHLGDNENAVDCTSGDLLDALSDEELAEVTAVVDGHSHTLEQDAYTRDGYSIPVIQTQTQLIKLGRIDLSFDGDGVSAAETVLDYDTAMAYPLTEAGTEAAARVEAALEEIKEGQAAILDQVLCTADTPLWGSNIYWDYAESRVVETSYGDFVTDAFAAAARVFAGQNYVDMPIVAIENGGGISAILPNGKVTRGDVLNAFNHGNVVQVFSVTPAQLYAALEPGLVVTGQDDTGLLLRESVSGSFMQVSGFTYTYAPSAPSGAKVTSVRLDDGSELLRTDGTTKLLLATNSYVASAFPAEAKLGDLGGEDQIVMDYILTETKNGTVPLSVPVTQNRIRIADDKSPETYTVAVPVLYAPSGDETPAPGLTVHLRIDDGEYEEKTTDETGALTVELAKGPHTLYLKESVDGKPVYVNNYSGSGTVTTRDGYYRLGFLVESGEPLPVTRETAVNNLWIMEGRPVVNYLMTFSDVPAGYAEAVRWAASEGITSGYSDESFGAEDIVTKEQFVTMLYRYAQSKNGDFPGDWMFFLPEASDREEISEWAYEAVCWGLMNGVIEAPNGGALEPQSLLTRAQLTDMLTRYGALGATAEKSKKIPFPY